MDTFDAIIESGVRIGLCFENQMQIQGVADLLQAAGLGTADLIQALLERDEPINYFVHAKK